MTDMPGGRPAKCVRVLLAEDRGMMRGALALLLGLEPDIAATVHLSESTVRNHLSSAIGKTGTRNRMEAVREARRQGWL